MCLEPESFEDLHFDLVEFVSRAFVGAFGKVPGGGCGDNALDFQVVLLLRAGEFSRWETGEECKCCEDSSRTHGSCGGLGGEVEGGCCYVLWQSC